MCKEKDRFYIAGKIFDSLEEGLKYEQEWLRSYVDQETFERLWENLGKDISMNIFMIGREISVKDFKAFLEEIFSQFIGRSQGYPSKHYKSSFGCDASESEIKVSPYKPTEFWTIPERKEENETFAS